MANWSAAIFVAAYGDWATKGWSSVIGTNWAVPYVSEVEVWIILETLKSLARFRTFNVPFIFVST